MVHLTVTATDSVSVPHKPSYWFSIVLFPILNPILKFLIPADFSRFPPLFQYLIPFFATFFYLLLLLLLTAISLSLPSFFHQHFVLRTSSRHILFQPSVHRIWSDFSRLLLASQTACCTPGYYFCFQTLFSLLTCFVHFNQPLKTINGFFFAVLFSSVHEILFTGERRQAIVNISDQKKGFIWRGIRSSNSRFIITRVPAMTSSSKQSLILLSSLFLLVILNQGVVSSFKHSSYAYTPSSASSSFPVTAAPISGRSSDVVKLFSNLERVFRQLPSLWSGWTSGPGNTAISRQVFDMIDIVTDVAMLTVIGIPILGLVAVGATALSPLLGSAAAAGRKKRESNSINGGNFVSRAGKAILYARNLYDIVSDLDELFEKYDIRSNDCQLRAICEVHRWVFVTCLLVVAS